MIFLTLTISEYIKNVVFFLKFVCLVNVNFEVYL